MKAMLFDGSKCPFCGNVVGSPDFTTRATYLWANQHGYSKRIFCGKCDHWTDYVDRGDIICTRWRDKQGKWHQAAND